MIALDPAGGHEVVVRVPSFPMCIDFLPDGRLLVVDSAQRRLLRREPDGSMVTHADLAPVSTKPWNDLVVDASGNASVPPEAPDGKSATVAGCTGVALGLLDEWLSGHHPNAPADLAQRTTLPGGYWVGERAATDILVLAAKRRTFRSLHTLTVQQGGRHVLYGSALALAAAAYAWSQHAGTPITELARAEIR